MEENAQQFGKRAQGNVTSTKQKVSELRAELAKLSFLVKRAFFARGQYPKPTAKVHFARNQQGGWPYNYNWWGSQGNQGQSSSRMPLEGMVKSLAESTMQIK